MEELDGMECDHSARLGGWKPREVSWAVFSTAYRQASEQQKAIDIELRTPRILTNKVVTACQGVPHVESRYPIPQKTWLL